MILRVTYFRKFTNADGMWNLRLKWTRHQSREKMRAIPHLWSSKMLRCRRKHLVDRMLLLTLENVLVCRAEGKRGQKHDVLDVQEAQAKTKPRLAPRRGQKRESTQPLRGRGHVDSSCCEGLCSGSRRLEFEYGCSCQFLCGCEREC